MRRLGRELQKLASGGWKRTAAEAAGAELAALVREGFDTSRAPNDRPWKPTVKGNKPLIGETGELSGSVGYTSRVGRTFGASVEVRDRKAVFHQKGTRRGGRRHIPPRRMVPGPGATASPRWIGRVKEKVRAAVSEAIRAALRRARS